MSEQGLPQQKVEPEISETPVIPALPRATEEQPPRIETAPNGNTQVQLHLADPFEPEDQIEIAVSNIPREMIRNGGPISDIPEFKPEDPLSKTAPTRPQSFFTQLQDPAVAAHEMFEAIRGGAGNAGTTRILSALAGKDGDHLNDLIRAYRGHYDRDLLNDLRALFRDNQKLLKGIETIFEAIQPEATAALLNLALTAEADHRELVNQILGGLDPDEMIALRNNFRKHYGADVKDILTSKLAGDDLRLAIAILEKNQYDGFAVRLHEVVGIAQRDTTPLARLLTSLPQEDLQTVGVAFARIYGGTVVELGKRSLTERQLQALEYALKGDAASAQAVLLKDALSGSGDIRILSEVLLGSDNELRDDAVSRYKWIFGREFGDELRASQDLPKGTKLFVERIFTNGAIELVDYLYRELTDAHLNTARLITLFSALPLERCDHLIAQCKQIYSLDPDRIISQRLSGADRFDVRLAMLGKPEAIDDLVDIANAHHEYDRAGGVYGICSRLLDTISPLGGIYDRSIAALNQQLHQHNRPDRLCSDDDTISLVRLAQYCEGDSVSYRRAKHSLAGFIARSCAALAAIISFSLVNLILYGTDLGMAAALLFGCAMGLFVHGTIALNLRGNAQEGTSVLEEVRKRKHSKHGRRLKYSRLHGRILAAG